MKKVICDHAGASEACISCRHSKKHKPIGECKVECGLFAAAKCVEAPE